MTYLLMVSFLNVDTSITLEQVLNHLLLSLALLSQVWNNRT